MMEESSKYVLVEEDDDVIFALKIFNDYSKAVGEMMLKVWEFESNYQEKDDEFKYTSIYNLEGDSGVGIEVTYKSAKWNTTRKRRYMLLEVIEELI